MNLKNYFGRKGLTLLLVLAYLNAALGYEQIQFENIECNSEHEIF